MAGLPTITGFRRSPDGGRGLARDLRVRWALEEAGQSYAVELLDFAELKSHRHLARNPFGQIPTYASEGLVLFESGAILWHLGQEHPVLLPAESKARARAVMWMFAALNTVEPPIFESSLARVLERDRPWFAERQEMLEGRVRGVLGRLADRLGQGEWLEARFSAGDLLMVSVLRRLGGTGIIEDWPNLAGYVARGEARPAFQRALAAQRTEAEAVRARG
ncbi:glutathione S-transferase family protein [Tabrizicola soli]|uniref:Glutathione S-transferase family protein n=1 Tax=Tabrizicola soli TaxID=2185115 RepID=A0ABV7DZP5_9RHOB|nr:glutathione S-transferase family protein [Tabrizicola soli]